MITLVKLFLFCNPGLGWIILWVWARRDKRKAMDRRDER